MAKRFINVQNADVRIKQRYRTTRCFKNSESSEDILRLMDEIPGVLTSISLYLYNQPKSQQRNIYHCV